MNSKTINVVPTYIVGYFEDDSLKNEEIYEPRRCILENICTGFTEAKKSFHFSSKVHYNTAYKKYGQVFIRFNLGNIKMMRTAKAKKMVFLKRFIVAEIGSQFNSFQYGPNNVQVDNTNFQNQLKKVWDTAI